MTKKSLALITGANRGLGKETSRQLAHHGYTVIMTGRDLKKAQAAADEIGQGAVAAQLDVADPASIATLAQHIMETYGQLDVLVNNAAIHYDTWQRVSNINFDTLEEAIQTNVYGAWRLTVALLPALKQSDHARIVNVSSGAGAFESLSGGTPAYSLSKVALNALTIMLAKDLKRDNILVNAVCPGWVATDMGGNGGRPVKDGASGIVWAAMLPDGGATGSFFRDGQQINW